MVDLDKIYRDTEAFRDRIGTVDEEGKRIWISPKKPSGRLYNARTVLSWFLLAFFFSAPFIKINGQPLLLLNILERKFVIFGVAFWPQDFHLFALAALTFLVFVILFTVIFGRVFCGWICPQTIFLEMVFRKIEYWIEGDAHKQRSLNKAPWTPDKAVKKVSKWTIFYLLSFLIGNTFLAYLIGVEQLWEIVSDNPQNHIGGLSAMIIFSGVFYFVFAWFREQACIIVCPYGRLQGVLLDQNSIVVAYDFIRGEPRGKLRKNQPQEQLGDCIACGLCEQVCPTGIDIKNGTQLECVNCTACIDACDSVMDKINKPRGLIRYDSYTGIQNRTGFKFTPRMAGYSLILLLLLGLEGFLLSTRVPVETTILRTPGTLFQELPNGQIQNLYSFQVVNKSFDDRQINLRLLQPQGTIVIVGGENTLNVAADDIAKATFFVRVDPEDLPSPKTPLKIVVSDQNGPLEEVESIFAGPIK